MNSIWPIAIISFREGIRNRALYGISLFALLLLGANFLVSGMIPREVGKVAVDMALSTISLTGLLLVLFIGINLLAKDMDKRTIYMVLARPISRQQYIIGKFLGMVILIIITVCFLGCFAVLSLLTLKTTYHGYFDRFAWQPVFIAIGMEMLMLILLTGLSFLFASFSSTSFITLILTMISYIIGQSLTNVKALVENPSAAGITVSPLTVKMVRLLYYIFPNLSLFDLKLQAAHSLPVSASYIFWTCCYGIIYTVLSITIAGLIFQKKEFP